MDVIAPRGLERPNIEARWPGVMRASIVLVWHSGQGGRRMIMMLRLGSGGNAKLSVSAIVAGDRLLGAGLRTVNLRAALVDPLAQTGDRRCEGDHDGAGETHHQQAEVITETRSIDLGRASAD